MEDRKVIKEIEYRSTVTITQVVFDDNNTKMFLDALESLDPGLFLVKRYLDQTGVNPGLLPSYIMHLAKIDGGSGYGRIVTEIKDHKVTLCSGTDSVLLELDIKDSERYNNNQ